VFHSLVSEELLALVSLHVDHLEKLPFAPRDPHHLTYVYGLNLRSLVLSTGLIQDVSSESYFRDLM